MSPLAGIFVGGESRRMGTPKGLLVRDGVPLVQRWLDLFAARGVPARLVGRRPEYAAWDALALDDDPPGVGPAGGLAALLRAAGGRDAIAVACDMPFVTDAVLARLLAADARPACAARRDDRWEPFFARYRAAEALPVLEARIARGACNLQGFLDELGARELAIEPEARGALADWDTPEDVRLTEG